MSIYSSSVHVGVTQNKLVPTFIVMKHQANGHRVLKIKVPYVKFKYLVAGVLRSAQKKVASCKFLGNNFHINAGISSSGNVQMGCQREAIINLQPCVEVTTSSSWHGDDSSVAAGRREQTLQPRCRWNMIHGYLFFCGVQWDLVF